MYQFGTLGCRVKHSPPDGPTPTVPPLTLWYSPHVSTSIRIRVREASASTRTMVSAIALAFLLTVGVAILQQTFPWTGTTAQFLILSAVMATLSLVAAAFFRARSRIVHGAGDSWIGLIFLLMGLHFTLRVLLAPLQLAPRHLVPIVLASWITTQLTSAIILLVSMSGHLSSTRRGSAMVAGGGLVLAGATFAIVLQLKQAHIVVGIQSLNTAILMTFLAATVLTLVHAIRERQSRAIWLGTAFIVITAGHADLSWSMKSYDSPFMWGHVLLLIGLTIPIVTAVSENLELMASQASLNRRIRKLGRRVEALLDSLPVLVVTLDAKTHLRYANRRAHRLLGIPPSTSSTSDIAPWTAGLTTEDRERLRRDVTRLISGELDGVTREVRLTSPDDTVHWLSLELRPIHDPVEDEPRILVAGAEITDLLAAQRTAERRHERLTLLTNLAQSLSVETTEEGVLGRLLELGAIQFGMEAVAVLRAGPERRHLELGALAGDLPELRRALEDGPILDKAVKSFNDAFPLVVEPHAEEHPAPLNRRVAMTPLLAGGQAAGVLVLAGGRWPKDTPEDRDVLLQIGALIGGALHLGAVLRELDEQRNIALEASRLKSEFLANTSHELRTPLSSILGFLQLILDGHVSDTEAQQRYLRIAHESATRLLAIINDVLDLAKIEAGRLETQPKDVPVAPILSDLDSLFRHQARDKGVELIIPRDVGNVTVFADPDRTRQILINLLSNALKFTPSGGTISVEVKEDGDMMLFLIHDTGLGIPPDELDRVFDSFHQVDGSTTRAIGGTGLGLTISRRLARGMGGDLSLESEGAHRGTTARLVIPRYRLDRR